MDRSPLLGVRRDQTRRLHGLLARREHQCDGANDYGTYSEDSAGGGTPDEGPAVRRSPPL